MGHADRSWLHNALSLDAQSWRIRLSLARRGRLSHSNSYRDGNSHCDTNSYGYSCSKSYSHAKTASEPDSAVIAHN